MRLSILFALVIFMAYPIRLTAEVNPDALTAKVLALLKKEFPDAQLKRSDDGKFSFSHKTRDFTMYRSEKTGEWQKSSNEIGPDRGGFVVQFALTNRPWEGAAVVPYIETQDLYVFQESHVIKDSADEHWHIWSIILNPPVDGHEHLRAQLSAAFTTFDAP